jgi:hypothetical protein
MEINHYGDNVLGAVATENIVEGRMVCLTSHTWDKNYGSLTDVPGVKLPADGTDAAKAKYCVAFEQDNRSLPIYQPHPRFSFALRYGFDLPENAPFNADVYLTHPGVQIGRTIPSGSGCVLYGPDSILTVPSGAYVYDAALEIPGATMDSSETATHTTDTGKLRSGSTAPVAEVVRYNSDTKALTFRIL